MSKSRSKILLLSFVFIFTSFSVVFAGEQEKTILKTLERVSSLSERPGAQEFREAFADCQGELKIARMAGTDYPEFMKVAEETFLLFKDEKELWDEVRMMESRMRTSLVQAKINGASEVDRLRIEGESLEAQSIILNKSRDKRKAGQQRLEDLYRVYKEEVLKR